MTNNEMLKLISDRIDRIESSMKKMMERLSELEPEIKKAINLWERPLPYLVYEPFTVPKKLNEEWTHPVGPTCHE